MKKDTKDYREEVVERWSVVEDFVEQQKLKSQVDIEQVEEGVKVTLGDSLTFNSGSSDLLPTAKLVLEQIAGVFTDEVAETEVQGHTDTDPVQAVPTIDRTGIWARRGVFRF